MKNEIRIKIDYPKTVYSLLNQNIVNQLNMVIQEFINYQKQLVQQDINYTLDILDEQHNYNDYISYVFYISINTGGAHPNQIITTLNYDRRKNKMITINDLNKNDILNVICTESRKQLQKNENIASNPKSMQLMMEGTIPNKNNYKNFIFGEKGLIIFFQQYQLAPYSSGILQTTIPYSSLKNEMNDL